MNCGGRPSSSSKNDKAAPLSHFISEDLFSQDAPEPLDAQSTAALFAKLDAFNQIVYDFVIKYYKYIYRTRVYYAGCALTMLEAHILTNIGAQPGITACELAKKWDRTPAFLSQTIRHLEEEGFVRKAISRRDRKYNDLYLTAKGKEVDLAHQRYDIRSIIGTNRELLKQFSLEQILTSREVMQVYGELIGKE